MNILRALVRIKDFFLQDVFKPNNWSYDVDNCYYDDDEYEVIQDNVFGNNYYDDKVIVPEEFTDKYTFVYGNLEETTEEIDFSISNPEWNAIEFDEEIPTPYTEASDVDQNQTDYEDSFTA